jgi:hypothetical protein
MKEFNNSGQVRYFVNAERQRYLKGTGFKGKKKNETNPHRLAQRQKQIMYGENTDGYMNFLKSLDRDPTLTKGCLPLKPSIIQRCSKRSWDGQVRKWRRALHMYDFVDFGESKEQSHKVRLALIEQNKNPLFTPAPTRPVDSELGEDDPSPLDSTPSPVENSSPDPCMIKRVRYSLQDMLQLAESSLVIEKEVRLPESLQWLDKRTDLEDDVDDEGEFPQTPDLRSPYAVQRSSYSPFTSPAPRTLISPRQLFLDRQSYLEDYPISPIKLSAASYDYGLCPPSAIQQHIQITPFPVLNIPSNNTIKSNNHQNRSVSWKPAMAEYGGGR